MFWREGKGKEDSISESAVRRGSRPDGAGGEEQPQHVLVWRVSQELVVDHLEAHADVLSHFNIISEFFNRNFFENSLTAVSKPIYMLILIFLQRLVSILEN